MKLKITYHRQLVPVQITKEAWMTILGNKEKNHWITPNVLLASN